jgi:hypothetical protein
VGEREIVIFGIVFPERGARALDVPVSQIGIGVFIGAIEGKDELLADSPPGNEIQAQDNRGGDIVDVHRSLPEPARPVAIAGVCVAVPVRNEAPGTKSDHVHLPVLSVVIGN